MTVTRASLFIFLTLASGYCNVMLNTKRIPGRRCILCPGILLSGIESDYLANREYPEVWARRWVSAIPLPKLLDVRRRYWRG